MRLNHVPAVAHSWEQSGVAGMRSAAAAVGRTPAVWMRVSAFRVDDAKARYRKLLKRDEQRTDTDALVEAL